jgi:hypothetical protein
MTDTTPDRPEIDDCCPRSGSYPGDTPTCGVFQGDTICTRPEGHAGPHTACHVAQHQIETWDDTS